MVKREKPLTTEKSKRQTNHEELWCSKTQGAVRFFPRKFTVTEVAEEKAVFSIAVWEVLWKWRLYICRVGDPLGVRIYMWKPSPSPSWPGLDLNVPHIVWQLTMERYRRPIGTIFYCWLFLINFPLYIVY